MHGDVNRNNFDSIWLEIDSSCNSCYTKFQNLPLKEKKGIREHIKPALIEAILDHHFPSQRIKEKLKKLGFSGAAKYFSNSLPINDKTRKGNFGEVITSEHLCQRHNYKMPVFKLRFMDNPNMPMRGEDIVAFEIAEDKKITAICIGETKTLEIYSKGKVKQAYEQIVKAHHSQPTSLSLICNILYERGEDDLAKQIDEILETLALKPFPRHNWIFIITGNKPGDPFGAIEEMDTVVDNLRTVSLCLPQISLFVNEVFKIFSIRS